MRILEYKMQHNIFVKSEITKLSPLNIKNDSDNYNLVIPSLISELPDNIMFIQECIIINPKSSINYIPKLIKLGINISQSFATPLPKGIEIRLLIIDNISDQINNVSSYELKHVKNNNSANVIDNTAVNSNNKSTYITDNTKVNVDNNTMMLLQSIDNKLLNNNNDMGGFKDNTSKPIVNEFDIALSETKSNSITQQNHTKRGRGRPRKYSTNSDAEMEMIAQNEIEKLALQQNDIFINNDN